MRRIAAALILFGISFGYVEAAIVVYLRTLYEPLRAQIYPQAKPDDVFPLIRLDQLKAAGRQHAKLLAIEVGREAATLVMLAGAGLAISRSNGQWLAGFAIAFGVWDIAFYAFLKLLIDWPASLFTWDLLFLIPVPWAGPVLAPVIVSATMIVCGFTYLKRPLTRPTQWGDWLSVCAGGLIVILSFTLNYHDLMAGGTPNAFAWWLFAAGEALGLLAFARVLKRA
jgi:hypothetical protein